MGFTYLQTDDMPHWEKDDKKEETDWVYRLKNATGQVLFMGDKLGLIMFIKKRLGTTSKKAKELVDKNRTGFILTRGKE